MEGWVDLGHPVMHWLGVELAISRSQVRRPNHYTTKPPMWLGGVTLAPCGSYEMRLFRDYFFCYKYSYIQSLENNNLCCLIHMYKSEHELERGWVRTPRTPDPSDPPGHAPVVANFLRSCVSGTRRVENCRLIDVAMELGISFEPYARSNWAYDHLFLYNKQQTRLFVKFNSTNAGLRR